MTPNYAAIAAMIVAVGAMASTAMGHPALAVFFNDPATATEATAAMGALAGLVSGFSGAVHKPVVSPAKAP